MGQHYPDLHCYDQMQQSGAAWASCAAGILRLQSLLQGSIRLTANMAQRQCTCTCLFTSEGYPVPEMVSSLMLDRSFAYQVPSNHKGNIGDTGY